MLSLCDARIIILEIFTVAHLLNIILRLNTRFSEFHLFRGPRQLVFAF